MQYVGLCEHWVLRAFFLSLQLISLALSSRECSMQVCVSTGYLGHPSSECSLSRLPSVADSAVCYHWRELPQVPFLLRHKVCCDKSMLVMTKLLSWQNYVCHDYIFGVTKLLSWQIFKCLSWQMFWQKMCLSPQNFCCDKNDTCGSSCQW